MPTEDDSNIPEIDVLLDSFGNLLKRFDPSSLTYLDRQGNWEKNPSTIRDRISNELWFQIWESSSSGETWLVARSGADKSSGRNSLETRPGADGSPGKSWLVTRSGTDKSSGESPSRIRDLIFPLIQDPEHWALARRLFQETVGSSRESTAGKGHTSNQELTDLRVACEALSFTIEYEAYKKNSDVYVAEWDSRGKAKRASYSEKCHKILDDLKERLSDRRHASKAAPSSREETNFELFLKLNKLLKDDEEGIFSRTALIIAEEEKLRSELQLLLTDLRDSRQKDEVRDFITEQLSFTKGVGARLPRVLVRPCLDIMMNPEIDVSTGMQFEASGILGRLRDARSADTLLTSLGLYDPKYTDLRANITYALGNLKHPKAMSSFVRVLEGPDSVRVRSGDTTEYDQPRRAEKCEAIWALGKLGSDAIEATPALVRHAGTDDKETRLYLAWAMGTIGNGQKEKYGGIDASVLTALMNLLTAKQSGLFEEAAFALKKLGLPDFLHTLYLHDLTTVPILSLKPSSTGLYELSETLLHLASIKKPVVMAVTGDSGTGKTYFCQTVANGFSGIKADEILYLMRDRIGDRTLDRILGIRWLRKHITAQFCEGYPLTEDEDDPEEFFDDFIRQNADKKLIILDGWRDHAYFHQVVRTFYEKGYLDVLVKFQTTFSTRRINLEEREGLLEKVKLHLPLVEDPAIEETPFYKEGAVLIYNLDNSIPSRLSREETLQVFEKKKVDTWADQIRIGRFTRDIRALRIDDEILSSRLEDILSETQEIRVEEPIFFSPSEASFSRVLNDSIDLHPNLLQSIKLDTLAINRATFYAHGQIACCGYDGNIAVLTGLNDRILYVRTHDAEIVDLAVVAGDIYSLDTRGTLMLTSFYRNTTATIGKSGSHAFSLASYRDALIATGHADGTIRLWNMQAKTVTLLKGHMGPVLSLAIDHHGTIYSGAKDMELRVWDVEAGKVKVFQGHKSPINAINIYPDGRIVTGTETGDRFEKGETARGSKIRIVDVRDGSCKIAHVCNEAAVNTINVYFDGRLFVGTRSPGDGIPAGRRPNQVEPDVHCVNQAGPAVFGEEQYTAKVPAERVSDGSAMDSIHAPYRGTVFVLDLRPDFRCFNVLEGHRLETRDCVTMGPRLITCGSESGTEHTLRIWGTVSYVEIEHGKSRLMPEATGRPSYYSSLF